MAERSDSYAHYQESSSSHASSEQLFSNGPTHEFAPIQGGDRIRTKATLSRTNSESIIGDADRRELQRIVTALSHRRTNTLDEADQNDVTLDPQQKDFDLSKWLRKFIQQITEEGITLKQVGVVYKNLNVSGSGAALQLQQTVGSFLMAPLRLGEFFSFGKRDSKRILQNFDGLLKSGELLIVLGRPGSGCSTLLKTLCGELHGLDVNEGSTIHYNGIPQQQMIKEFKGETAYNQEVFGSSSRKLTSPKP